MPDYVAARRNMVENQLRPNRIEDPQVLMAMEAIPRELFVPKALRGVAYSDEDLSFEDGRRLIEPLALAKLLQAAMVSPQDVALVIGCDTGYAAAVLSRLAATVFLLLPKERETAAIDALLSQLDCDNVVVQQGDPGDGLPSQAPFDVLLLAGSVPEVPDRLLDQLGENGRLAAVVQDGHAGAVTIYRRVGTAIGRTTPYDAWLPPLAALRPPPRFVF